MKKKFFPLNLGSFSAKGFDDIYFVPVFFDRILEGMAAWFILWGIALFFRKYGLSGIKEHLDLLLFPSLSLLVFVLLYIAAYNPISNIKFPVYITRQNAWRQHRLAVRFVRLINVEIALLLMTFPLLDNFVMMTYVPFVMIGLILLSFLVYFIWAYWIR